MSQCRCDHDNPPHECQRASPVVTGSRDDVTDPPEPWTSGRALYITTDGSVSSVPDD